MRRQVRVTHEHDHTSHHDQRDQQQEQPHDLGLQHDLGRLLGRRQALALFGGLGAGAVVAACGSDTTPSSAATGQPSPPDGAPPDGGPDGLGAESSVDVADGEIPEETAGPFPADGSNGPDVLGESGIVRSDLTRSFGAASGVAAGVPLAIHLRLLDLSGDTSVALAGAAVYLWHCDAEGRYSMYDDEIADENYLRGVQETDSAGRLTFTSIVPACYSGRWPHLHFEVYPSLAKATSAENKMRTSQIAFPSDVCEQVYASDLYPGSADNLGQVGLDSDMVFGDGHSLQLATLDGSVDDGYTLRLTIPVWAWFGLGLSGERRGGPTGGARHRARGGSARGRRARPARPTTRGGRATTTARHRRARSHRTRSTPVSTRLRSPSGPVATRPGASGSGRPDVARPYRSGRSRPARPTGPAPSGRARAHAGTAGPPAPWPRSRGAAVAPSDRNSGPPPSTIVRRRLSTERNHRPRDCGRWFRCVPWSG